MFCLCMISLLLLQNPAACAVAVAVAVAVALPPTTEAAVAAAFVPVWSQTQELYFNLVPTATQHCAALNEGSVLMCMDQWMQKVQGRQVRYIFLNTVDSTVHRVSRGGN